MLAAESAAEKAVAGEMAAAAAAAAGQGERMSTFHNEQCNYRIDLLLPQKFRCPSRSHLTESELHLLSKFGSPRQKLDPSNTEADRLSYKM